MDDWGGQTKCLDARCYDGIAIKLQATHWLAARLVEGPKRSCFATVVLEDLLEGERDYRAQRKIAPCTIDNAVAAAQDLGRQVARGPRTPIRITESFTDLAAPSLSIPSLPDLKSLATSTTPRDRKDLTLDRALGVYKRHYLIAFSQELDDDWHTFVARNGKLVDECTVRKAAGLEISDALDEYCHGNNWEWAWLGVPVGAVVSLGSIRGLQHGTAPGVLGFVFGALASLVSGTLALALNVDSADPKSGEYWSHWLDLERMVETGNEELRRKLHLSAAEVEAAGMRR